MLIFRMPEHSKSILGNALCTYSGSRAHRKGASLQHGTLVCANGASEDVHDSSAYPPRIFGDVPTEYSARHKSSRMSARRCPHRHASRSRRRCVRQGERVSLRGGAAQRGLPQARSEQPVFLDGSTAGRCVRRQERLDAGGCSSAIGRARLLGLRQDQVVRGRHIRPRAPRRRSVFLRCFRPDGVCRALEAS